MRKPIVLPDLGDLPVAFGLWHVRPGERVYDGDRLAEVLIGSAAFELAAAADGTLAEISARPGDALHVGQVLGYLESN